MKKIVLLFAAVAAIAACTKESEKANGAKELVPMSFTTVGDPIPTRSSLNENFGIVWSSDDKISVFSGSGTNTTFEVESLSQNGSVATFKGLAEVSTEYYALFPAQEAATISSGVIQASLASEQQAVKDSFGPSANLSVGKVEASEELQLKNVGAILGVQLQAGSGATGIRLESIGGESLSGTAAISYNNGEPEANISSGNDYVQLTSASALEEGTYYFVVYPGSYAQGFRIIFTKPGYSATMTSGKALTLARNDNVNLTKSPLSIPAEAWKVQFTPGEKVYLRGVSSAEEQEVTYVSPTYYDPCYVNPADGNLCGTPGNRGDANNGSYQMDVISYNYEVWAKIDPSEAFYFETESGARFGLNEAGTAVAPIGSDETGEARTCYNSPFRIRINLPSGEAQILRASIVNFAGYYTGMNVNLNYDQKGSWKVDNQVFSWTQQTWDPDGVLTRYLFKVWFDWKGSAQGGSYDVWQTYGTCSSYNNLNIKPQDDDPSNPYYYLQPFTQNGDWEAVFYWGTWMFDTTVNDTKKGTINLYMNNTYGHFTHNFTNIVDNDQ